MFGDPETGKTTLLCGIAHAVYQISLHIPLHFPNILGCDTELKARIAQS